MKHKLIALLSIGALTMGSLTMAQNMGPGPGPGPSEPPPGGPPEMMPPDIELPEEVAVVREELLALRQELAASRQAVVDALADDATREDRRAALDAWRNSEDTAALMEDIHALNQELRAALDELGIGGGWGPVEVPEEIQESRDAMRELAQALGESRRAVIDALGEDATIEERRAALDTWRLEHEAELAELAVLREEVGGWMKDNRPDRGRRPGRGGEMNRRVQEFREGAVLMRAARERLRTQLASAETEEERREIISQFRARFRDLMQDRKELKRLSRLEGQGAGGDRRPGD